MWMERQGRASLGCWDGGRATTERKGRKDEVGSTFVMAGHSLVRLREKFATKTLLWANLELTQAIVL